MADGRRRAAAIVRPMSASKPSAYAAAGVDIDAQEKGLARVKKLAKSTFTPGVLTEIGSFGGLFRPELAGMTEPVLVASADGVGTKLVVAKMAGDYSSVGRDLVNHCVNDILVQGAEPLFFMDYLGAGVLEPEKMVELVSGRRRRLPGERLRPPGRRDGRDAGLLPAGRLRARRLHRRPRRPPQGARRLPGAAGRRPGRAPLLGAPHQRLLAGPQGRLREGRPERSATRRPGTRRGRWARRCWSPTSPICKPIRPSSAPRPCTAWPTSPAAASRTTCRASCPRTPTP